MTKPLGDIFHPRKEIRDALFDILKDKIDGIKSYSKNRFRPYWEENELPGLCIYTLSESAEVFDEAPRRLKRVLSLAVEIVVRDDKDADDILDKMCLDVENAIHIDETLNCKASDCRLTSTELVQKVEGNTLTGSAILSFDVTYFAYAPNEQVLKDFKGADFTMKVGGENSPVLSGKVDVSTT